MSRAPTDPPTATGRPERRDVDAKWQATTSGSDYRRTRFRTPRAAGRDARLVAAVLRRAGAALPPGASGLDVPCGTGRMAPALRGALGREGRWFGADISAEMLAEVPGGGPLARASAFALPFPDGAFDVVLSCRFLHHHADPSARRAALAELARVSRGWVVASWWDAASWKGRRVLRRLAEESARRGTRTPLPWSELSADLAAAGLNPLARAWSMRFVSPQAFFAARRIDAGG